jgi:muconate cycloisomerase
VRIAELAAFHARIPLKRKVRHASHTRTDNDALLVRCKLDDGTVGWGEGLPRPYVTGETIDSAWDQFGIADLARMGERFDDHAATVSLLEGLSLPPGPRACFGNSVRCAIEISILDAVSRALQKPLWTVMDAIPAAADVREARERVQYSAAITSAAIPRAAFAAAMYRYYGFHFCKVKVGSRPRSDGALLRSIRTVFGRSADLRVDANEAWSADDVERRAAQLRPSGISAIEQPLPHEHVAALREIRPRLGVPIVLDESLCSVEDACRAIDDGLCDIFNLRLSKCGGFVRSAQLAAMARAAGLASQLGCQVGETGILSAAGRHFACSVKDLRYVEGSFDRLLVAEPLIREDITFRRGGWAPRLDGPGLGITVDEDAVQRVTLRTLVRKIDRPARFGS